MSRSSLASSQSRFPILPADQIEWRLWWWWVGVTTVALFIMPLANSLIMALLGISILAVGQWLLLRPRIANAAWWLLVTPAALFVGSAIGGVVGGQVQDGMDNIAASPFGIAPIEPGRGQSALLVANLVAGGLSGTILAFCQWLVLRRAYFAGAWFPATIIGLTGALLLGKVRHPYLENLMAGAWIGAITGAALLWCLRRPKPAMEAFPVQPVGNVSTEKAAANPQVQQSIVKKRSTRTLAVSAAVLLVLVGFVYYYGTRVLSGCQSDDPQISIKGCSELIYNPAGQPDNEILSETYTNRGVSYDKIGQYDNSLTDLNEAIRLNPKNARAYHERGVTYWDMGRIDAAVASFGDAIRIRPIYSLALRSRGRVLTEKGEYDRAIADFDEAIRIDERDGAAYYYRGVAYQAKGNRDQAIADYSKASEIDPFEVLPRDALKAIRVKP